MNASHVVRRAAAYVWAGPNTLLGLMAGLLVLGLGGRAQCVRGVIEFHGGLAAAFCSALPGPMRFSAITFGHVILGVGAATLIAVFLVPALFVAAERIGQWRSRSSMSATPPLPAHGES